MVDEGGVPEERGIMRAVHKPNEPSPGRTGVSAVAVKEVAGSGRWGAGAVMRVVGEFLETEKVPVRWEDGLLKVLPKSGDLSKPGKHRGVMLLEALYKATANIIKPRLAPIQESLEQEPQCGFRPGRAGCTNAPFSLRVAIKK